MPGPGIRLIAVALVTCALLTPPAIVEARVVKDRGASFMDLWLQAATEVALFAEPRITGPDVGDITVEADGSQVVLRGMVDSADAWHAASAVARHVPGVQRVSNELVIVPPSQPVHRSDERIAADVERVLHTTRTLDGARIRATAHGGIVRLRGSVRDASDWALASRAARDVVGVRAVDNRLVRQAADLVAD